MLGQVLQSWMVPNFFLAVHWPCNSQKKILTSLCPLQVMHCWRLSSTPRWMQGFST